MMRILFAALVVTATFLAGCAVQAPTQPQASPTPVLPAHTPVIPTSTPLIPTPTPQIPTNPPSTPTVIPTAFTLIPVEKIDADVYSLDFGHNGFTVANGSIWASNSADSTIRRIDLETKKETARIGVPFPCAGPTVGFDSIWVIDCTNDALVRINMNANKVTAKIDLKSFIDIRDILVWENAVWVVSDIKGILVRIDPATNQVTDEYNVDPKSALLTAGFGSIWVSNYNYDYGTIQRLDPATNQVVATINVGNNPMQLGVGEGSVWVYSFAEGSLYRIDPLTNSFVAIPVLDPYTWASFSVGEGTVIMISGSIWLTIIDQKTNLITRQYIPLPDSGLSIIDGKMWIGTGSGLLRVNKIE